MKQNGRALSQREMASRGGKARAQKVSPEKRKEDSSRGGKKAALNRKQKKRD